MKPYSFLSAVVALVLVVAVSSCTPLRDMGGDDEYYETEARTTAPTRIYVDDPYAGTVVLERDPFTGRYYQVGTMGGFYRNGYSSPYSRNNRFYNGNNRGFRNNRVYQNSPVYQRPGNNTQQQQQQQADRQKQGDDARRRVLGGN